MAMVARVDPSTAAHASAEGKGTGIVNTNPATVVMGVTGRDGN